MCLYENKLDVESSIGLMVHVNGYSGARVGHSEDSIKYYFFA